MKLSLALLVVLAAQDVCCFDLARRFLHAEGDGRAFLALPTALERRASKGKSPASKKAPASKPKVAHAHAPPSHGHAAAPAAKKHSSPASGKDKPVLVHKPAGGKSKKVVAKAPVQHPPKGKTTPSPKSPATPKHGKPTQTPKSPPKSPAAPKSPMAKSRGHGPKTKTSIVKSSPTAVAPSPPVVAPPPPVVPPPATTSPTATPAPTQKPGCPKVSGGINTASTTPDAVTTVAKTADGPAPTRSAVACTKPPSGFDGTKAGFADLCSGVRYCDPAHTETMQWQGPNGDVQRIEIETLLGDLQGTGTHLSNGQDNALSDGWMGLASYGAGLLFEITGDRRALDVAVRIADNMVATRNDPNTGRVMWTGNREPIWPTKPESKNTASYYGCESMHVVGHLVNVAIYILKTPCLWSLTPQLTSGPTVFDASATYLDRAKTYIATGDSTFQQAYLPYYFTSNGLLIAPNDPRYTQAHDFPPGTWMPWNRRMMVLHGLMRLATAHGLDPLQDAGKQQQYDGLVDANIRDYVSALNATTSRGYNTYIWNYARVPPGGSVEMVNGIHAFYDIWGSFIAHQHGSAPDALSDQVMQNLANTMQHQIWSEDSSKTFAAYVSGQSNPCNSKEAPRKAVWGGWAFYGKYLPDWYGVVAASNERNMAATWTSSTLLWAKAAMYRNSDTFWQGMTSTASMPAVYVG